MEFESAAQNNIETFNLVVGMVLADLYANFPVPITLSGSVYSQRAGIDDGDASYLHTGPKGSAESAISWLVHEGFVRAPSGVHPQGYATNCVLTLQGLRLLSLPQALEKQESIGEGLRKATAEGAKDGLKSAIGGMVKTGLIEGGKAGLQLAIQAAIQSMK